MSLGVRHRCSFRKTLQNHCVPPLLAAVRRIHCTRRNPDQAQTRCHWVSATPPLPNAISRNVIRFPGTLFCRNGGGGPNKAPNGETKPKPEAQTTVGHTTARYDFLGHRFADTAGDVPIERAKGRPSPNPKPKPLWGTQRRDQAQTRSPNHRRTRSYVLNGEAKALHAHVLCAIRTNAIALTTSLPRGFGCLAPTKNRQGLFGFRNNSTRV